MKLDDLRPAPGSTKKQKRVGRGDGSGHGKTACRGHKGQRARAGGGTRPGFEGGQMPLQRRLPKRGFNNPFKVDFAIVNLDQKGLVHGKNRRIKILGDGALSKSLTIKAHSFSAKAKEKIEAAGGKAELITSYA